MPLQQGQVIRYDGSLWRVDYVNECRARIVPVLKRHVVLSDGREFDADRNGVNISPNSWLPVVTDLEMARDEIELQTAEAELKQARQELKAAEIAKAKGGSQGQGEAKPTAIATAQPAHLPSAGRSAQAWRLGPEPVPAGLTGLKAQVIAVVQAQPGRTTKAIASAIPDATPGAVGACLDRFRKAGVLCS